MNRKRVNKVWSTKDDVMEDLALATGVGSVLEVDEHCLVYGERPPPRPVCDIDDEMKILFGAKADKVTDRDLKFVKPDLKGIMSMIRMVESEDDSDFSSKSKSNDVIVISKLNPNVREFVPKNQASQTLPETKTSNIVVQKTTPSPKKNDIVVKKTTPSPVLNNVVQKTTPSPVLNNVVQKTTPSPIPNNTVVQRTTPTPIPNYIVVQKTSPTPNPNNNVVQKTTPTPIPNNIVVQKTTPTPIPNNIVVQKTTPTPIPNNIIVQKTTPTPVTERKDYKKPAEARITPTPTQSSSTEAEIQSLKDIIVRTNTKNSYQHRIEKNAAIATLLRHCTTPPVKKESKEKPIKLYTPEFFEHCKAADFKGTDDSSTEVYDNTDEPIETIEQTDPIEPIDEDEHTNLTPDVAKDLTLDNTEVTEPISTYEEVEQKKSIDKVKEWLEGPSKPKKTVSKPVILAGPIAYKRKEVMSPTSTTSTTVIDKKISKQDDKAFVPSTYAMELRQKYERKKKEANKPLNIWDNLEEQLKKKDEEIKKKASRQD